MNARVRWLLAASLAVAVAVAIAFARGPTLTHAEPARVAGAQAAPGPSSASQACGACHAGEAREWEGSRHHTSASDPLYESALALEPQPFCRACHAPAADPARATPPEARENGITCIDCHANATVAHAAPSAQRPRVRARACASCHEFAFPDGRPGMQRTASEHGRSAFRDTSCESCHMPSRGTHRMDHSFTVDDAMLRSALVADVERTSAGTITLRITPGRVGHAMPTGDLFRRVVIEAELRDATGAPLARRRRDLARQFSGATRVARRDDRIGEDLEPCFELDFGPTARGAVHLEVAYERVAHPLGPRPERAQVASRALLLALDLDGVASRRGPCP